ncbi:MAG: hypothetical protein ABIJ39_09780 [Chloroflexota bacterium]
MKYTSTHPFTISALLLLGLTLCLPACVGPRSDEIRTFLLRSDTVDIAEVPAQLITAISFQLEQSQALDEGYPIPGRIELEPDPYDPGAQLMRCVPAQLLPSTDTHCLRLDQHGAFVRAQAITWESAAFYMYRVYVAPKSIFARINPSKDFVALDVFILEDVSLWYAVDEAIRDAAVQTGARPFQP